MCRLRLMNKRFLLLLMAILILSGFANGQTQTLVLWHTDGSTTDVDLYTEPKIVFTDNSLLITSSVLDMEYAAEEIIRFTFKGKGTGIDTLNDDSDYLQQDGRIVFHQISAADHVAIYRPNGIQVPVRLVKEGDSTVLSLSSLPKGAYVISVNGRTSKFLRR